MELFTQLYSILCFVSCIHPPTLITNIFFVFPFFSPHDYADFGYSMTTAAPSEIGIITFHKGDNTALQLSFRKCKTVCYLLIINLSVFLGTWPKRESCQLPPGVTVTASDDVCPQVSCNLIIYRGMSKEKISVTVTAIFDHQVLTLLLWADALLYSQ